MKFLELYTLVWEDTRNLVPAIDEGADGMLFTTLKKANAEAKRQTKLYSDGTKIVSEKIELRS